MNKIYNKWVTVCPIPKLLRNLNIIDLKTKEE
jgi:hypothetical protein